MGKKNHTRPAQSNYEVGKNKPPKHGQFKKGQSGNPGGKKKFSLNLKTIFEAVLSSEITITENGQSIQQPILVGLVKRQVQKGLQGDLRALENLFDRLERHSSQDFSKEEELPSEDEEILRRANARGRSSHDRTAEDPGVEPLS